MAQRVSVVLEDDLDGGPADSTITFAYNGSSYEIDLNSKNADKFEKAISGYVEAARKVGGSTRAKRGTGSASRGGSSKEELAKVREWAKANGHDVSERGRISGKVMDAYNAAN